MRNVSWVSWSVLFLPVWFLNYVVLGDQIRSALGELKWSGIGGEIDVTRGHGHSKERMENISMIMMCFDRCPCLTCVLVRFTSTNCQNHIIARFNMGDIIRREHALYEVLFQANPEI